jgi:hypothetical protein
MKYELKSDGPTLGKFVKLVGTKLKNRRLSNVLLILKRLLILRQHSLVSPTYLSAAAGADLMHLMIKPHTPSP